MIENKRLLKITLIAISLIVLLTGCTDPPNGEIKSAKEIKQEEKEREIAEFRYDKYEDKEYEEFSSGTHLLGDPNIGGKDSLEILSNVKDYIRREREIGGGLDYMLISIYEDELSLNSHIVHDNYNPKDRAKETPKIVNIMHLEELGLYKLTEVYKFNQLTNQSIDEESYELNDDGVLYVENFDNAREVFEVCKKIIRETNRDFINLVDLDNNSGVYDEETGTLFVVYEYYDEKDLDKNMGKDMEGTS